MTKSVKRILIVGIILSFPLLLGSGLVVYSTADPDSTLGFGVFRVIYATPIPKGWFLQAFSEGFRENNGGYIGQPVDEFLCSRLEITDSDAERIAIAEFYISQASGREGFCINKISDESKEKVVGLIMNKLDSYEPNQARQGLLIVEWLRSGEIVCKARISRPDVFGNEWQKWWLESGADEAKSKYRTWWNTNLEWQDKKQINPLAESNIKIYGGCG